MPCTPSRRAFLQLLASGAAAAAFPASISRALEIPAHSPTGTINDVEHIVFLMQENRSFDHYFGTLRGVRGFGDPRAVTLRNGKSAFHQPHHISDGHVLPFHPGAPNLGLQFLQDLPHDWTSTHQAWNRGHYDQWIPAKGPTTMAHLTRSDIPFHYALADAFTICDAYHCSLLGPTDPNRMHMWTGWVGNDGRNGGPAVDNDGSGYSWSTYPEVLEEAGISWKVYQDTGTGLNKTGNWGSDDDAYVGNYGDNALLYFKQYQDAKPGSPLHTKAVTGTDIKASGSLFEAFRRDIAAGKLPQVSWIAAPEAYTEHPNWPANYGAWYISQILDALTANPEVWGRTVFFLMYDENDGFFDHVVPATPPQSRDQGLSTIDTVNEIFPGNTKYPAGAYGLGIRVPMIIISPWSKGGWVNSQVFDHTSMIRFLESRFAHHHPAVRKTNITPWRRAVAGDLTSAFNFAAPNAATVPLPRTIAYQPPDNVRHPDYVPQPPARQALPQQEKGTRPARAVPYELHAGFELVHSKRAIRLHFHNTGESAAVFHVRNYAVDMAPRSYTVGAGHKLSDEWPAESSDQHEVYYLSVYGPNGFVRSFKGDFRAPALRSSVRYQKDKNSIILELKNDSNAAIGLRIDDAYSRLETKHTVPSGKTLHLSWPLNDTHGWYDLAATTEAGFTNPFYVQYRFAGHLETGKDSFTDPAIADPEHPLMIG